LEVTGSFGFGNGAFLGGPCFIVKGTCLDLDSVEDLGLLKVGLATESFSRGALAFEGVKILGEYFFFSANFCIFGGRASFAVDTSCCVSPKTTFLY